MNSSIKTLLFACLYLIATTAFSQFDWEQLDHYNGEKVQLQYVTNEGHFIASISKPQKLVISYDQGQSWEIFYEGEKMKYISFYELNIKQDENNFIYIGTHKGLLKYLSKTKDFEFIIKNRNIEQFGFLSNSNIVVTSFRYLILFSSQGIKLRENDYDLEIKQLLLGDDEDHLLIIDQDGRDILNGFNSDFNSFDHSPNRIPVEHQGYYYYTNNRLFSYRGFSDNEGRDWTDYNVPIKRRFFNIGTNGRLILLRKGNMYLSDDYGDTFIKKDTSLLIDVDKLFVYGSSGIACANSDCLDPFIYSSIDNGKNYISSKLEVGLPYAYWVSAGHDGSLATGTCNSNIDKYKNSSSSKWIDWKEEPGFPNGHFPIVITKNGNIISKSNFAFALGKSWFRSNNALNSSSQIFEKNNVLYAYTKAAVAKSIDYGRSWVRSRIDHNFLFNKVEGVMSTGIYILSDAKNEYFLVDQNGKIAKIDLTSFGVARINAIETSYTGNSIYILAETSTDKLFISSTDGGVTYQSQKITFDPQYLNHILSDRYNNIYLYGGRKLLISQDYGDNWEDITPSNFSSNWLSDIDVGYDGHIYLATYTTAILKSKEQIKRNTSIEKLEKLITNRVSIYPNPISNRLNFNVANNTNIESVEIFNLSGVSMIKKSLNGKMTMTIKNIPSGIYLTTLKLSDGESEVHKIIIEN